MTDTMAIELPQSVENEALVPDVSRDFFTISGDTWSHQVQIKPLKLRYQIQVLQALQPVMESVGIKGVMIDGFDKIERDMIFSAMADIVERLDVIPSVLLPMLANSGISDITEEMIQDSYFGLDEVVDLLIRYAKKSRSIERVVQDFFMPTFSRYKNLLTSATKKADELADRLEETLSQEAEKMERRISTTSSKKPAKHTA